MKALCFDQASGVTGWAVGDSKTSHQRTYEFGSIKTPKRDQFGERLAIIFDMAAKLIEAHKPDMIGYEEPFFPHIATHGQFRTKSGSGFTPAAGFLPAEIHDEAAASGGNKVNLETLKQLQMVKGAIITVAALYGLPSQGCTSSTWRKTTLGVGRIPKEIKPADRDKWFKREVRAYWLRMGYDTRSDDESDALGVLFHTLHGPEAAKRAQGDLLSMVSGKL